MKDKNGQACTYARAGDLVTVDDIKGKVNNGDKVYKITDKNLMKEARDRFEGKPWYKEKLLKKVDIKIEFQAYAGKYASIKVHDDRNNIVIKSLDEPTQEAVNKKFRYSNY
ncbi:hypothetical protein [Anaerovorax odorimutans]|uniref:hypothetical protein n=1 Tax=Anaerovorax odorimutans TaxID=109327 RepID=UPI0003F91EC1|nr:hypothetical protein [Anaerovorax odorimutans]